MAISLSKETIIEITGGSAAAGEGELDSHKLVFHGVEYDSRQVKGGELFVALKGEKEHGHAFLKQAFSNGAALALVEDPGLLKSMDEPARLVVVSDTLKAFWKIANYWRRETKVPLLAVTGSVGKTTVKEMASSLLLRTGPGAYSMKSHNNHVGVPYTLCRIGREHAWAVIEMGMNHPGEIKNLSVMAEPDVAVITKIAPAHVEQLGSLENIARAKLEILEGLGDGPLVVNGDDPVLLKVLGELLVKKARPIRRFGMTGTPDVLLSDVVTKGFDGVDFALRVDGQQLRVHMNVLGQPSATNAACAVLAVKTLKPGFPREEMVKGLSAFTAPLMRLNLKELSGGRRLIDDSYNANPASMRASLELAGDLVGQGQKVGLMLGDMLELGERADDYHREIGDLAAEVRPVFLIAVGERAALLAEGAAKAGIQVHQAASAEDAGRIAQELDFEVLVVKASRGVGLDRAVALLCGA